MDIVRQLYWRISMTISVYEEWLKSELGYALVSLSSGQLRNDNILVGSSTLSVFGNYDSKVTVQAYLRIKFLSLDSKVLSCKHAIQHVCPD